MKKTLRCLFSVISFVFLIAAKNPIKTSLLITSSASAQRWYVISGLNAVDTIWDVFPIDNRANKLMVGIWRTDDHAFNSLDIYTNVFRLDSFKVTRNDGVPSSILWAGPDGTVNRSPITSIPISTNQISGYSPGSTQITQTMVAGSGMSVTNGANSFTFTNTAPNVNPTIIGAGITSVNQAGSNYTVTSTEVDGSVSNELQTVSGTGTNTLTLSDGGGSWSPPAIVSNTVTRSLNSSFTISLTQDMDVDYSIYSQVSSALAGTNTADAYLEVSTTSGGTYTTIANGGVMAAGVLSTNGGANVLSGFIPAGYWVRIRTSASGSNAGSAVFTYRYGRENNHK